MMDFHEDKTEQISLIKSIPMQVLLVGAMNHRDMSAVFSMDSKPMILTFLIHQ